MLAKTDLITIILAKADRINQGIALGAAFEIWLQLELAGWIQNFGFQVVREVEYTADPNPQRLDILFGDANGVTNALEIKVESANNSGAGPLKNALENDITKIKGYDGSLLRQYGRVLNARWVLGICYSNDASAMFEALKANAPQNVEYGAQHGIGVVIISP